MCSRYSRKNAKTKVGKRMVEIPASPQPVIRPTDRASILRAGSSDLEIAELRWGLIPSWAQDPKIGVQCINARSETVAEKPAFRFPLFVHLHLHVHAPPYLLTPISYLLSPISCEAFSASRLPLSAFS